jgi:ribosomal protein S6
MSEASPFERAERLLDEAIAVLTEAKAEFLVLAPWERRKLTVAAARFLEDTR